jgi:hypothetical protein
MLDCDWSSDVCSSDLLSRHPELVATATGGECPPCEINRICRLCHTPARSADFDLARALARVRCGADVAR